MSMNISAAGTREGEPCVTVTLNLSRAMALQVLAVSSTPGDKPHALAESWDGDLQALATMSAEAIMQLRSMGAVCPQAINAPE